MYILAVLHCFVNTMAQLFARCKVFWQVACAFQRWVFANFGRIIPFVLLRKDAVWGIINL